MASKDAFSANQEISAGSSSSGKELLDLATFEQLLEMDDDQDRDFSKSIVWNYFEQAEATFKEMEDAITTKDLSELSSKGHFLKGSSAAVGVKYVKLACEDIQNFGAKQNSDRSVIRDDDVALEKIEKSLKVAKEEFAKAEAYLKDFYKHPSS